MLLLLLHVSLSMIGKRPNMGFQNLFNGFKIAAGSMTSPQNRARKQSRD
uniref:Uncharacterized protein n=1 Tax=Rhizophora mucronata TaxID=61149 RepID=A0A2P2QN64_RHIMU